MKTFKICLLSTLIMCYSNIQSAEIEYAADNTTLEQWTKRVDHKTFDINNTYLQKCINFFDENNLDSVKQGVLEFLGNVYELACNFITRNENTTESLKQHDNTYKLQKCAQFWDEEKGMTHEIDINNIHAEKQLYCCMPHLLSVCKIISVDPKTLDIFSSAIINLQKNLNPNNENVLNNLQQKIQELKNSKYPIFYTQVFNLLANQLVDYLNYVVASISNKVNSYNKNELNSNNVNDLKSYIRDNIINSYYTTMEPLFKDINKFFPIRIVGTSIEMIMIRESIRDYITNLKDIFNYTNTKELREYFN